MFPYQALNKVEETYHRYPHGISTFHNANFIKRDNFKRLTKTKTWTVLKETNEYMSIDVSLTYICLVLKQSVIFFYRIKTNFSGVDIFLFLSSR